MKLFLLFFNFYLLVLPFTPCNDVIERAAHSVAVVDNQHHQDDEKDSDNCTPFCICSCCALPIINTTCINTVFFKPTYCSLKYASIKVSYPSQPLNTVWQPPKFC